MKNIFSFVKKEYKKVILTVFAFLIVAGAILSFYDTSKTQAGTAEKFSGYAWSENIGWISFNCTNQGSCNPPTIDYGVTYDQAGSSNIYNVSGYAWSENIGWIKFGNLTSIPAGGENAKLTLNTTTNTATLTGWARACAGTVSGTCADMTSRTDGWDGWISLNGTTYGISFKSTTGQANTSSYAWGSDVVGWISFDGVVIDPLSSTMTGSIDTFSGPDCIVQNPPGTASSATISWTTTNMNSCKIYRDGNYLAPDVPSGELDAGSRSILVQIPESTFALSCVGKNGTSYNSTPKTIKDLVSCVSTSKDKRPGYIER